MQRRYATRINNRDTLGLNSQPQQNHYNTTTKQQQTGAPPLLLLLFAACLSIRWSVSRPSHHPPFGAVPYAAFFLTFERQRTEQHINT